MLDPGNKMIEGELEISVTVRIVIILNTSYPASDSG